MFQFKSSANSVMRGCVHARRTLKGLVADLRIYRTARKGELYSHTTANSIRHIIETLSKFQNIEISEDSISEYIKENIPNDKKSYTFINDLSHGGWRSEQEPMTNEDYQEVCEAIIKHIEKKFPKQIKYCEKCCS